jgi:hypothetical protein
VRSRGCLRSEQEDETVQKLFTLIAAFFIALLMLTQFGPSAVFG